MTQSVELLLDPDSEAGVVHLWRLLADAGLASQARHRGGSNRPHVTLTAGPSVPEEGEERLPPVLSQRLPLAATLGGVVVFGTGPVTLARLVVATAPLLAVHQAVADLVDLPEDSLTAPGRWTPHVTLALRMPLDQVPAALRVLGAPAGLGVRFDGARRWDGVARRTWSLVR